MIDEAASGTSSTPENIRLQWGKLASVEELADLWVNTFVRTPDYYGYSIENIEKEATDTINSLYQDESPDLHPSSVVARRKGRLVGMLLLNENKARPLIEALAVRPGVQHRGVGTAMVEKVAQSLQDKGENVLCSGHLLANAESAAWHESVGFVEIPDWLVTNHRFRCAEHNLGTGRCRDVVGMKNYVEMLRTNLVRMYRDRDEDRDAHSPFRWVKSDGDRIDNFLSEHVDQSDSSVGRPRPPGHASAQ